MREGSAGKEHVPRSVSRQTASTRRLRRRRTVSMRWLNGRAAATLRPGAGQRGSCRGYACGALAISKPCEEVGASGVIRMCGETRRRGVVGEGGAVGPMASGRGQTAVCRSTRRRWLAISPMRGGDWAAKGWTARERKARVIGRRAACDWAARGGGGSARRGCVTTDQAAERRGIERRGCGRRRREGAGRRTTTGDEGREWGRRTTYDETPTDVCDTKICLPCVLFSCRDIHICDGSVGGTNGATFL